tara:strand:+ start:957 stop:1082 length:126 start_codon:yes stop_codon:yes gene_type:complete
MGILEACFYVIGGVIVLYAMANMRFMILQPPEQPPFPGGDQ